jgi:hypothetical protein
MTNRIMHILSTSNGERNTDIQAPNFIFIDLNGQGQ